MKKIKALVAVIAASCLLAGCSSAKEESATDSNAKGTEIVAWAWDPNFNIKALNIANDIYQKDNPDKVNLKIIDSAQEDVVKKLNTSLSSGVKKGLPNIVLIEDYRAPSFLKAYPDAFVPVDDVIKTADFAPYKVKASTVDGHTYGIPFDSGVAGLYVRTDILEEAGFTLDDVTNVSWKQLIEVGKKVKEKTGVKLVSFDLNDPNFVRSMINASGKWYTKEDGATPDLEGNEAIKTSFEDVKAIKEADLLDIHNDWGQFLKAFNSGKVFTVPTGNWITPSVMAETSQEGKWAVVPFPSQGIDGSVNASNLGGSSFYVLNIEGKEQALDFLSKTVGSSVDFYENLVNEIGAIGTFLPAFEAGIYNKEYKFFGGQRITEDFTKWMKEIPEVNFGQNTYAIEAVIVTALQDYLKSGDIDATLKQAQEKAVNAVKK